MKNKTMKFFQELLLTFFDMTRITSIISALVAHANVAEAAVVGYPHPVKGQSIYAFVTVNAGVEKTDELKKELVQTVRKEIGPIATPEVIQWADALPKTRSGKIMRRILKKVAFFSGHIPLGRAFVEAFLNVLFSFDIETSCLAHASVLRTCFATLPIPCASLLNSVF